MRDRKATGTGSRLGNSRTGQSNFPSAIGADRSYGFMSGWAVKETAGAAATVNIRDSVAVPGAPTIADGAAGNSTAAIHYGAITYVTANGEGVIGPQSASLNSAGTTIIAYTGISTAPTNLKDPVIGRNVYITKANAPVAAGVPTNAQWFLATSSAGLLTASTTVAAGSNAQRVPDLPASGTTLTTFTLTVASTAVTGTTIAFKNGVGNIVVASSFGPIPVAYASTTGTTFVGCTSEFAGAVFSTGGVVTQPLIPENTSSTYNFNLADANVGDVRPSAVDKTGEIVVPISLAANESQGENFGQNVMELANGGGLYVEVATGAVQWMVKGE